MPQMLVGPSLPRWEAAVKLSIDRKVPPVYTQSNRQTEPADRVPGNPGRQCQPGEALMPQRTCTLAWGPSTFC
jgi:hypothetical protein